MFWESWTTQTNNSKEGFSHLVLGFLLDCLAFGGNMVSTDEKNSFKLCEDLSTDLHVL